MKYIHDFVVKENLNLNDEHFILTLSGPQKLPEMYPGQFLEVLVEGSENTFLRRPLSIHNVDYKNNTLQLFIKRAGEATRHLGKVRAEDKLNIIYPLGNSFSMPEDNDFLLIGGGCGIAPLLFLAKHLNVNGFKPKILIGARTGSDVHEIDIFRQYGEVFVATDDGSMGEKGFVTQHSILKSSVYRIKKYFACGPELMLKAVAKIATDSGIECEVSLENTMACGIGACLCCIVETKTGNKCVCTEGPVFNIKDLKWG